MVDENVTIIKPPAKVRVMSYCGDLQGCGHIRVIFPNMLLNLYRGDYSFDAMYSTNFINDPMYYKNFSFVQFQRAATETHLALIKHYIKNIRSTHKIPVVYEIDDALVGIPKWNFASKYYSQNEKSITEMMKIVNGITVSTQPLKELYSKYNNNISVVPNHLPKFLWGDVDFDNVTKEKKGKPRIGWAGSENHFINKKSEEYKNGVVGGDFGSELINFIRKTTDIYQWVLSGAMPIELDDIKDKIEFHKFVNILDYPRHLRSLKLDIFIAPLLPCAFNDCKCLVGNTLVVSDNGIINIKSLKKNNTVWQKNSFERINGTVKYKNKNTLKITTSKGFNIEGTFNHKISSDGNYVELSQLKIGDKVDIGFFEYPDVPYQEIEVPLPVFTKTNNDLMYKVKINERWGRFIGYLLGDGNIGQNESTNISCDTRYPDIVDDIMKFGYEIGLSPKTEYDIHSFGCVVRLYSRNLKWLMNEKIGFKGGKNKKILEVPEVILKSPKLVIKEFLRGLFETNGIVSIKHSTCSFTTKSQNLAETVHFLLLGFGIISTIVCDKNYYTVLMYRQATDKFYEEIGFISQKKQKRLFDITLKPHLDRNKEWEMFDVVTEIIEFDKTDVYDIEVPVNNFYLANGIISHNSNIKALESVAIGCPGVYSNAYPYKDMSCTSNDENGIISYIEKLASDFSYRKEIFDNDYKIVGDQLFWEENNNLVKYINSYLALFNRQIL